MSALQALELYAQTAVSHVTISRYLSVAGFCVMLYDHLLTFSQEIDLIWYRPMKPVSFMFLFNRYVVPVVIWVDLYTMLGLATDVSSLFCQRWLFVEGIIQSICFAFTHTIVAYRVRALYSKKPIVDYLLLVTGISYFISTMTICIMLNLRVVDSVYWMPGVNLCMATITNWTFTIWVPALVFEVLLFTLTLIMAAHHVRRHVSMPVATLLYRDGFMYFLVISSCSVFNIVVWTALPPTYVALAKYFTFALVNTMSSRLVLNLRALRRGHEDGPWLTPSNVGLDFPLSPISPGFRSNPQSRAVGLGMGHVSFTLQRPPPSQTSSRTMSVVRKATESQTTTDGDYYDDTASSLTPGLFFVPARQLQVQMEVEVDVEVAELPKWDKRASPRYHRRFESAHSLSASIVQSPSPPPLSSHSTDESWQVKGIAY